MKASQRGRKVSTQGRRLAAALPVVSSVGLILTLGGLAVGPIWLVVGGVISKATSVGLGRGFSNLLELCTASTELAVFPTGLSAMLAAICIVGTTSGGTLQRTYQKLVLLMVFVNPIFYVFGFQVLLSSVKPALAVSATNGFITFPLASLVLMKLANSPEEELESARTLGANEDYIAIAHVGLKLVRPFLRAWLISGIYALGFFLVPTYVGLGRVVTLSTTIHNVATRLGDWNSIGQLGGVTLLLGIGFACAIFMTDHLVTRGARCFGLYL